MTLQGLEAVCELWQYAGLTTEFSIKYPNFFSYSLAFNQVIVFSFMGDFRGRVIHAHFDGTDIIVKKTNLYHFYPVEKPRKTFELFLRQMASTPIGDIKAQSQDILRPSTPPSITLDELRLNSD